MNTNGFLLDEEKINYLIDHKVTVLVSCDGPEPEHNNNRFNQTANEHTLLLQNIKKYLNILKLKEKENSRLLVVNATVKNDDVPFKNICDFFVEMGVKNLTFRCNSWAKR